jgi:iron complex outermembrane receptor protein
MRKSWRVVSLLASAAIIPGGALAQQAGGAAPQPGNSAAGDNGASAKIEQVIVTAEKRTTTAQRTPIAIRVVSGRTLQAAQVTDVQNLTRVAPDLGVVQNTVYTQLAIRGVSAQTIAEGADAALTVDIDGEYINRPVALNAIFFDLARIEVLKGPQGTLYGRNATAGAINIITAKPVHKYEGYLTVGAGNYGSTNFEGAVNIPLTPDVAVRLAGFHSQHGGYLDNGAAGHGENSNQTGARVSIEYNNDGLTAYVSGEYTNVHSAAPPSQYGVPISPGSPGLVRISGVDQLGQTVTDYVPSGNLGQTLPRDGNFPLLDLGFFHTEQYHLRYKLGYEFGDGFEADDAGGFYSNHTATSIPLTGTPNYLQFYSRDPHLDSQDFSNDLHVSYHAPSGLFAQVGAFYFHENQDVETTIQIDHPPFGPPGTQRVYVNYFYFPNIVDTSYAFYGQGDYPILPDLKVTAGVRYSHDEKSGVYYNSGLGFIDPNFGLSSPTIASLTQEAGGVPSQCNGETAGANDTIIDHCYSQGEVNWMAGLEYTPAPNHLLFFKASTAYRSGGFDNASGQVSNGERIPDFQPEHITSYEVGSKNTFLDNRLQLNLDLFRYDYTNLQVDSFLNTTIGHFTANAGQASYNGAELDGIAAITDNDRLSFTVNYLDATFDQFKTVETGIEGNAVPVNLAGNTPPEASKWTLTAGFDHTFNLGDYGDIVAAVSTRYRSSFYLTSYNWASDLQKGFTSTDLSVTYTTMNGKYSIQGFAHNLENYRPLVYAGFTAGPPVNIYNFGFGAPLTFGVQATARF